MASSVQIPFSTSVGGNFTVPHNLGVMPGSVIIEMTSGGTVWFQPARYDASNLFLVASDGGLTGFLLVYASASPIISNNVGGNSTIRLQDVVDDASTLGDVAPALATGGMSMAPALSIANDVMQAIVNGGPIGQPFNWKWNRMNVTPFTTISLQSDYFVPNLVNLGWIENAWAVNINQTSIPKQKNYLEAHKDLQVTYLQTGYPGKICWLPSDQLMSGTWGIAPLGPTVANPQGQGTVLGTNQSGQQNPGPGVVYVNPIGQLVTPINATTAIKDPYGNLWCLTTFGTCGATQPIWPPNPTYPSLRNPNVAPTTVTDGSCVWSAISPKSQGFRLNPIPPQAGIVWQIQVVAQMVAPRFYNLSQYLSPLPDYMEVHWKQGFFAECYRRNPDSKIRQKYAQERQLFLEALDKAVRQQDREMDDFGFYPSSMSVMDTGWSTNGTTPALPFGPYNGW